MHIRVRDMFRKILNDYVTGSINSVLEVGATPEKGGTLLTLECFKDTKTRIGIHLEDECMFEGFKIIQGNSNSMKMFDDECFDCVLSSSVLEHDKYFWRSLSEMKRVLKSGGILIINVPGYRETVLDIMPFSRFLFKDMTFTYRVHYSPVFGDYYRFSAQAVREVFLEGLTQKGVYEFLFPPRIIGKGIKVSGRV